MMEEEEAPVVDWAERKRKFATFAKFKVGTKVEVSLYCIHSSCIVLGHFFLPRSRTKDWG